MVKITFRSNGKGLCSVCGTPSPGYDTLPERRFEFVPIWGFCVFFLYAMRRVNFPNRNSPTNSGEETIF